MPLDKPVQHPRDARTCMTLVMVKEYGFCSPRRVCCSSASAWITSACISDVDGCRCTNARSLSFALPSSTETRARAEVISHSAICYGVVASVHRRTLGVCVCE